MYKSSKSVFAFETIEALPGTPKTYDWKVVELTQEAGLFVLQSMAFENGFSFTNNKNLSTVIVSFYASSYFNELLELHLTGVKIHDCNKMSLISNFHLTVRCYTSRLKSKSFYYTLQHSQKKFFRFILTECEKNNQKDDISEFIGQQGFYNFSSAVLQKFLFTLSDFRSKGLISFKSNYLL